MPLGGSGGGSQRAPPTPPPRARAKTFTSGLPVSRLEYQPIWVLYDWGGGGGENGKRMKLGLQNRKFSHFLEFQ